MHINPSKKTVGNLYLFIFDSLGIDRFKVQTFACHTFWGWKNCWGSLRSSEMDKGSVCWLICQTSIYLSVCLLSCLSIKPFLHSRCSYMGIFQETSHVILISTDSYRCHREKLLCFRACMGWCWSLSGASGAVRREDRGSPRGSHPGGRCAATSSICKKNKQLYTAINFIDI